MIDASKSELITIDEKELGKYIQFVVKEVGKERLTNQSTTTTFEDSYNAITKDGWYIRDAQYDRPIASLEPLN